MKKKLMNSDLAHIARAYDYMEGFLDTLERFGFPNPGKCGMCDDYGCSNALSNYMDRLINRGLL